MELIKYTKVTDCSVEWFLTPHASRVSIFNPLDHISTTHHGLTDVCVNACRFMVAWLYIKPTSGADRQVTQSIAITFQNCFWVQPTVSSKWDFAIPFLNIDRFHPSCLFGQTRFAQVMPLRCGPSPTYHSKPLALIRPACFLSNADTAY